MTRAQRAVWIAQRLSPQDWTHNIARYLQIDGPLDVPTAQAAIRSTLEDLPVMGLHVVGEDPAEFAPVGLGDWELPVVDLTQDADPEGAAVRLMRAELTSSPSRPGRLFAGVLYLVGPERALFYQRCHHVLLDGQSAAVLVQRFLHTYTALLRAEAPAPLPVPSHHEVVAADLEYTSSQRWATDRDHWLELCRDLPPAPRLTAAASGAPGVDRAEHRLSRGGSEALGDLARRARTGWPAVAAATVAGYLHRVTGQRDLVLGWAVSGRTDKLLRAAVCTQSDVLPLRLRVGPHDGLGDLTVQAAGALRKLHRHQGYRSHELRADLGLPAGEPLTGPEVNVMGFPRRASAGPCQVLVRNLLHGTVEDTALTFYPPGDDLPFEVDVRGMNGVDLAAGQAVSLSAFADQALAAPGRPVARLERIAPEDLLDLRARSRGRSAAPSTSGGLIAHLDAVARRHGAAVAVQDGSGTEVPAVLTHEELRRRSTAVATALRPGPSREDLRVVAVLAPRGTAFAVCATAVLRAGAALLPLDPEQPPARLRAVLQGRPVSTLLVVPATAAVAAEVLDGLSAAPAVVDVDVTGDAFDAPEAAAAREGQRAAPVHMHPDDPAYVMPTSGSTGRPKAAVVTHGGLLNHLQAKVEDLGLSAWDTVAQNAPLSFDVALWQLFAPLLVGGRSHTVATSEAADPAALFGTVQRHRVSVLEVVPSLLRAALDGWDAGLDVPPGAGDLRWLLVTGEQFHDDTRRRYGARFPRTGVVNAYGPAECADDVTHELLAADDRVPGPHVPIGRPVRGTELLVLDHHLRPVPTGETGLLHVAGAGVGLGYLGEPGRTAMTFVAHPSGRPGERMYATGDLVRQMPDGRLEFAGRRDHQVKVRGQRIELGEVEAALLALPGVGDAVVTALTDPDGSTRLTGHVVMRSESAPGTAQRLREELAAVLPPAMVPADIVMHTRLALSPNGKIDRSTLAAHAAARPTAPSAPAAQTATAAVLAAFETVLGTGCTETTDFFTAGGHSVLVLQLVARLRRAGWKLAPADVYELRTATALGRAARRHELSETHDPGSGRLPLPPQVLALRADTRADPGAFDRHGQSIVLAAPADLQEDDLAAALQVMVEHHGALRLQVDSEGDSMLVRANGSVDARGALRVLEVGTGDLPDQVAEELRLAPGRLSPAAGRVLDVVLLRDAQRTTARVVVSAHHVAVDATSWRLLVEDMVTACAAYVSGGAVTLPAVPTSLARWADRAAGTDRLNDRANALAYWSRELGDDAGPAATAEVPLVRQSLPFSAATTRAVTSTLAQAFGTTVEDVLLTALVLELGHQGPDEVGLVVELESTGRSGDPGLDLERTVGWLTASFPVRLTVPRALHATFQTDPDSTAAALRLVKERRRTVPDEGVWFERLKHVDPEGVICLGNRPRPAFGLNHLPTAATELDGTGWQLLQTSDLVDHATRRSVADLNVHLVRTAEGEALEVVWAGDGSAADRKRAERFAEAVEVVVRNCAQATATRTPSDLFLAHLTQDDIDDYEAELAELLEETT